MNKKNIYIQLFFLRITIYNDIFKNTTLIVYILMIYVLKSVWKKITSFFWDEMNCTSFLYGLKASGLESYSS